jgi:hypothetical protein
VIWDNIVRGTQITCPHVERSCTSAYYSDRKLGVSEMMATAAAIVHFFTGNNIGARGELASRSLIIKLEVDRPDPENRDFQHSDPIDWTERHRADILRALYVIMLGNPQLDKPLDAPGKTRFKPWWRMVGSAVEHATGLYANNENILDFSELFIRQEETQDDDSLSLVDILEMMLKEWPNGFKAEDVTELINDHGGTLGALTLGMSLREFLYPPDEKVTYNVTARSVSRQLSKHCENPVYSGDKRKLTLLHKTDNTKTFLFFVDEQPSDQAAPSD